MRRRAHLRLVAGVAVLSLPVATASNAVSATPVSSTMLSGSSSSVAGTSSAFSGGVVTSALSASELGSGSYATPAWLTDTTAVSRRLRVTGEQRLESASPQGSVRLRRVDVGDTDIPGPALVAYQVAATTMAEADPECGIEWSLLAAIGRVETDHGRYGGARLRPNGVSTPSIRGVALDGRGPVRAVRDTDGGRLDGDKRWDRAVGPMQFLPSTWSYAGVDADGDGVRSPDNINDAALAAAVYLCAGPGRLDNDRRLRAAVHRYNQSDAYVDLVLRLAKAYGNGDVATLPDTGTVLALEATQTGTSAGSGAGGTSSTHGGNGGDGAGRSGNGGANGGGNNEGDRNGDKGGHTGKGGADLEDPIDALPGTGTKEPLPEPDKQPKPDPTDEPDPDPTEGPDPDPTDEPDPLPVLVDVSGVLALTEDVEAEDGSTYDQWYLDEVYVDGVLVDDVLLYVGDDTWLATTALADLDVDGIVETNLDELSGLLGLEVLMTVEDETDPAVVHSVDEQAYLPDE